MNSEITKPFKKNLKYITIDQISLKQTFEYYLYIDDLELYCQELEDEIVNRDTCCDDLYNLEDKLHFLQSENYRLKEKITNLNKLIKESKNEIKK